MTRQQFFAGISSLVLIATALIPSVASAAPEQGSLIQGSGEAVYWYATNGRRYVFPNDRTFYTWFSPYDFRFVNRISDMELAAIPVGGNVTYRPGSRLIKLQTDPQIFVVDSYNKIRKIESEAVAAALYGSHWRNLVDDVPDAFFVNYDLGVPLSSPAGFRPISPLTPDGIIR